MLRPSGTKEKSTVLVLLADKNGNIAKEIAGNERDVPAQKRLVLKKLESIAWQEHRLKTAVEVADDFYFDTTAQIKLDRWSKGRVVLLGDAGYVLSFVSQTSAYLAADTVLLRSQAWEQHLHWPVLIILLALSSLFPINTKWHSRNTKTPCDRL
ncbi:hypothetical protein KCU89_g13725, partial [Aureobasidium melanogenum]